MLKSRAIKFLSVPMIAGAAVLLSGAAAFADSVVVQPGDTLSGIAMKEGLGYNWNLLYQDNLLVVGGNPNLIFPGQVLQIPENGKVSDPVASTSTEHHAHHTTVHNGGSGSVSKVPAPVSSINWDAVAQCESGGDWSIDTGNGFYGGLQFTKSTWLSYGGGKYAAYANEATENEQKTIANKVLKGQGIGAWPVCGPRGE
jgi:LysM repeat protein